VKKVCKFRNFKNINVNLLTNDALTVSWLGVNCIVDLSCSVTSFTSILVNLWDTHAPWATLDHRKLSSPWITPQIVTLIKQRNAARRKWNYLRTPQAWEEFRKLRNAVSNNITYSFKQFVSRLISSRQPSNILWKNLRAHGIVRDGGASVSCNIDPNLLVNYFTVPNNYTAVQINSIELEYSALSPLSREKFVFNVFTYEQIKLAFRSIKTRATGTDEVSINMIMPILEILLPCLTNIFNSSIISTVFPSCWKQALVTPVPKQRRPTDVTHFRPIRILTVFSKALDKLIYDQIVIFLNRNSLFDNFQSGFRRCHSTTTALLRISEDIRLSFGYKKCTILVLLDFSKAFDCVIHKILLAKLKYLNFSEDDINWFSSYLSDRSQRVRNDAGFSDWRNVECGVPQGSVLGPLLYSIYISDISKFFS
jgi:hypothetical protein